MEWVWGAVKVIFDRGVLTQGSRIRPYCPRCGTPLSDHEMGQPDVYRTVSDPSVTVRFPLLTLPETADPQLSGADLLVWTTTPWTLVSNTAVAVHPDETYVIARKSGVGDRVVVAESLFGRVLGEGWHIVARVRGAELAGATYQPRFSLVSIPDAHVVVTGAFVTTEDGTGLVHLAPAFGADDMETGRAHGLPVVNPIRGDGHFEDSVPLVGGMFFQDADATPANDLADRADRGLPGLGPHRPYVDEVVITCRQCGSQARRVPEVIDAWYDSGSMPFARHGAPLRNENAFERSFPAQFICEAIDQTRGWFYSLMAVSTPVFVRSSFQNLVRLRLVIDERGRKISKHLGNVLEP